MKGMDPSVTYKNYDWMYQKYIVEELSTPKIADVVGCGSTTVFRWLRKLGIRPRSRSEACRGNKNHNHGTTLSENTRKKIGDAQRGKLVSNKTRMKMSKAQTGRIQSEKTRNKISDAKRGKPLPEKTRQKMSKARQGPKNPNYGKHHSPEARQKMGDAERGEKHHYYGKTFTAEHRKKIGDAQRGKKGSNWHGGISFEPYCPAFNKSKKEEIRESHGRKCFLCGAGENGRKHAVHHTDYNKMQGCDTEDWNLIPLCNQCHSKTNFNRWYWFSLLYSNWVMNPDINFNTAVITQW